MLHTHTTKNTTRQNQFNFLHVHTIFSTDFFRRDNQFPFNSTQLQFLYLSPLVLIFEKETALRDIWNDDYYYYYYFTKWQYAWRYINLTNFHARTHLFNRDELSSLRESHNFQFEIPWWILNKTFSRCLPRVNDPLWNSIKDKTSSVNEKLLFMTNDVCNERVK